MTSKDIIIKLIDNNYITGEEAYVLLNDVLKGEMVAVNESLRFNTPSRSPSVEPIWVGTSPITYTSTSANISTSK